MSFFLTGLAMILVIEGLLYAIAPKLAKKIAEMALLTPLNDLRIAGVISLGLGVLLLYLLRG